MNPVGLILSDLLRLTLAAGVLVCAGCRIPAIDPTGARIFSGTTTLASCDLLNHKRDVPAGVAVVPAVPAVPVKPPCAPPVEVVPVVPVMPPPIVAVPAAPCRTVPIVPVGCSTGQCIQQTPLAPRLQITGCPEAECETGPTLKVTPSRIVAPVGTEVVLAAGICDCKGYYVMRQPLEWMLAQDGVGQLMAVGKEAPGVVSYILRQSPQKVATNYARVHTSTIQQCLDRGTRSTADDVYLERGQSWITVTSPTEGTSHVVVWAPKEQNWDRRKATATIYWVDAVWQFPPAAQGRAGQKQILSTTVSRSGGAPVAGWNVRYEIVDGPDAAFAVGSAMSREAVVRTDAGGRATIELLPRSTQPGITMIKVQIIRPASARGDIPEMIVGQGQTAVSWNSPGLAVAAVGPSTVPADGAVGYRVEITNSGDLATRGVTLSYTPPAGVSLLNSTPAAQVFGQRYEWRIGELPARTTSIVELNCRAAVAADLRSCFTARSGDGLSAEGCATTRVFANALSVKLSGPDAVEVGREAKFLVEIANTGTTTLTNITASDTFDPGLIHLQGEKSPIVQARTVSLAPGQVDRFAVSFIVNQPGRQCHRMDVTADGGHRATARGCVTGTPSATPGPAPSPVPGPAARPPVLGVRVTGPPARQAGQVAEYVVEVTNTGGGPATNAVIGVQYGVNLQLKEATRGHRDDPRHNATEWRVAQIAPGETLTRQLNCLCLNPDDRASVRGTISSEQTTAKTVETITQIAPGAGPPVERPVIPPMPPAVPPMLPAVPPMPPVAGNLKVTIADIADPIKLGDKTTYTIQVTNASSLADQDVVVTLELSDGLRFSKATGPAGVVSTSPDGRLVELAPVNVIRTGEELVPFKIEATGVKSGKQKVRVKVKSARTPAGITAETETTVNMQPAPRTGFPVAITVDIANQQSGHPVDPDRLAQGVRQVLEEAGIGAAEISIAVIDDARMHALNRQYLAHDYPTDVLSFLLDQDDDALGLEGEIIVSADYAAREAERYGWRTDNELLLYVIHGALHLVGHDDQTPEGLAAMRAAETRHLARFGLVHRFDAPAT